MKNNTQGFTLIELLIVIAIIGILAAVLLPNLLGAQKRAYDTAASSCANDIAKKEAIYLIDNPASYGTLAQLNANADYKPNCSTDVVVTPVGTPDQVSFTFTTKHKSGVKTYNINNVTGLTGS